LIEDVVFSRDEIEEFALGARDRKPNVAL